MEAFYKIVRRAILIGAGIGGACLLAVMALVVLNVITRGFGGGIAPTYEIIVLLMVVTVSFALAYTGLEKAHIEVDFMLSRLSQKAKNILKIFSLTLTVIVLMLLTWGAMVILSARWWGFEETELISLSYMPFRLALVIGLVLFCLIQTIHLINMLKTPKGSMDK
jgi:TRAP-type C4-dicarboxylate transport system permease small subunit